MRDPGLDGRRVLVVEDEYLMARDVARAFEDAGAQVVGPVPSVRHALSLLDGGSPIDFAVLDVNLAGEAVYPLADVLAARGVPFVFATGYDAAAIPTRYARALRLEKPIDPSEVVRAVSRSIAGRGT